MSCVPLSNAIQANGADRARSCDTPRTLRVTRSDGYYLYKRTAKAMLSLPADVWRLVGIELYAFGDNEPDYASETASERSDDSECSDDSVHMLEPPIERLKTLCIVSRA